MAWSSKRALPTTPSRPSPCLPPPAGCWACNGTRSGASPATRTVLLFSPLSAMPAATGTARVRPEPRVDADCRNHSVKPKGGLSMDLQLAGKTVLITGGSKGIGKAAAEVLAEEGCNLILVARDATLLDATAAEIRAKREGNGRTIAADLSSDASVHKVALEAGEVDVLVNNAGAIPPGDL